MESVLSLDSQITTQAESVRKLRSLYLSGNIDLLDITEQLQEAEQYLAKLRDGYQRKYSALGLPEKTELATLKNNAFLCLHMNALAIKQRLRDRLRQRKFEIEKLE